jgi:hypothetical protein
MSAAWHVIVNNGLRNFTVVLNVVMLATGSYCTQYEDL